MPPGTESSSVKANPWSVTNRSGRMTRGSSFFKGAARCSSINLAGLPQSSQALTQAGCLPATLCR